MIKIILNQYTKKILEEYSKYFFEKEKEDLSQILKTSIPDRNKMSHIIIFSIF